VPTIYLERHIDAAAAAVWPRISDIRSPEHLTDMVHAVEVIDDCERACVTDHGKIVERIVSVDDDRRRVAYTATESPFPISQHNAAMTVTDDGNGCRLTWITDVEPAAVADALAPVLAAEFEVIVSRLTG
jgi:hypothetical protein